ncbi:MAG TPA: hypothetical protein VF095_00660 [Bacillota bacterium]
MQRIKQRYPSVDNFADELADHLGIDVEVFLGTDYNAVVEAMHSAYDVRDAADA